MLIAEGLKKQGVGTELKVAQIEFAMQLGGNVIESRPDLNAPMAKVYETAAKRLGLETTRGRWGDVLIHLRPEQPK